MPTILLLFCNLESKKDVLLSDSSNYRDDITHLLSAYFALVLAVYDLILFSSSQKGRHYYYHQLADEEPGYIVWKFH